MKKFLKVMSIISMLMLSSTACSSKSAEPKETKAKAEVETTAKAVKSDFPKKNITIIVPYNAGGGVDITTRVLADTAGKDYFNGNSLIVENKGGGGAVIGHTYVAGAKPDGYTLLAYTSAVVNNPQLKKVTYTHNDFKTLGMVCFDPEILVVPPTSKYKTFEEFVAYAKKNTVKVSTPGHSTAHHIAAIQFAKNQGLKFEYLHNDSASVQLQQLMGGHADAAFMAVGETVSQIADGSIIGLATMNEKRIDTISDVPTFKEKGVDMVYGAFRGYAVPKDVPDDVYEVLKTTFDKIITSQKFIDAMNKANIPYAYKNAEDFQAYADQESKNLEQLVPILKENK